MNMVNVVSLLLLIASGANLADDGAVVDYPEGYRSWSHVKSMIIQPGHPLENPFGGIHHIYANIKAMQGLSSGEYQQGAMSTADIVAKLAGFPPGVLTNKLIRIARIGR